MAKLADAGVCRSYVVKDTVSGKVSNEARVHVLVRSPEYWNTIKNNQPPVPQSASLSMDQGSELRMRLNATDDLDSYDQLTFELLEPPAGGPIVFDGSTFSYSPGPDYWGTDQFTFKVHASGVSVVSFRRARAESAGELTGACAPHCAQVTDGMLLSAVGTIIIDVVHLNAVPEPVCAPLNSGLFTDGSALWRSLADLNAPATAGDAERNVTVAALLQLRDDTVQGDIYKASPRTRALDQLGNLAARGGVIAEGPTSFDLACSLDGAWAIDMAAPTAPLAPLNLSLLAFDRDEGGSTTYAVLDPPTRGLLFATSALPGASYSQSAERTFLEIGDQFYQVSIPFVC